LRPIEGTRRGKPGNQKGKTVSQNHYSTKPKRRVKNRKRKDFSEATMAKVRKLEAAAKGK